MAGTTSSRRMAGWRRDRRPCCARRTSTVRTKCAPCSRRAIPHVQAPHQGGYVETPDGEGWFLHFNSTGAYGRIVHLQPVRWVDDWPIMGELIEGSTTTGQPVMSSRHAGRRHAPRRRYSSRPPTSSTATRWACNGSGTTTRSNANWSLTVTTRDTCASSATAGHATCVAARNTITQILQGRRPASRRASNSAACATDQRAGLAMLQVQPSWIGVVQTAGVRRVTWSSAGAQQAGPVLERQLPGAAAHGGTNEVVRYEYSLDDGRGFLPLGEPSEAALQLVEGRAAGIVQLHDGEQGRLRRLRLVPGFARADVSR